MTIVDPIAKVLGSWSSTITIWSIILRLGISFIFSAIFGCERANKRHSAGLRTFIVISLGSTLAGIADMFFIETFGVLIPILSSCVLIALSILSSRSIFFSSKNQIKGLTTAFAIWTCGIIGICIGIGFYTVAIIGFVLLILCLTSFWVLEKYLKNRSNHFEIHLELNNKMALAEFVTTIRKLGLRIDDIEMNSAYVNSGLSVYTISLTIVSPELKKFKTHKEIIEAIKSLDYVSHIEEME
mgnify:CR=1 FL=1